MSLRDLYADNGAGGDNVRLPDGTTQYDDTRWNPIYCIYGWPHVVLLESSTACDTCGIPRSQ